MVCPVSIRSGVLNVLILVFLLINHSGATASDASRCPPRTLRELIWGIESMHGPTLRVVGRLPGRFGGVRYEVKPTGIFVPQWDSALPNLDSPQGSPLYLFFSLTPEVREFFGFQTLSDNRHGLAFLSKTGAQIDLPGRITVPDSREFVGAIDAFNHIKTLPEDARISIAFYPATGRINDLTYLRKWAHRGELPWAQQGSEFHHDAYFHAAAAIQMPQKIVDLSRRQTAAWLEFRDLYLQTHANKLAQSEEGQLILREIEQQLTNRIDVGTGTLPQYLEVIGEPKLEPSPNGALFRIRRTVYNGASPARILKELDPLDIVADSERMKTIKEALRQINHHYRKFSQLKSAKDPTFTVGLPEIADDAWLENEIFTRARRTQEAIKEVVRLRKNLE